MVLFTCVGDVCLIVLFDDYWFLVGFMFNSVGCVLFCTFLFCFFAWMLCVWCSLVV